MEWCHPERYAVIQSSFELVTFLPPHPGPLPEGEGDSGVPCWSSGARGSAPAARLRYEGNNLKSSAYDPCRRGRAWLPLPEGEGWGEGEGRIRFTDAHLIAITIEFPTLSKDSAGEMNENLQDFP